MMKGGFDTYLNPLLRTNYFGGYVGKSKVLAGGVSPLNPANLPGITASIQVALSLSQGKLWQDAAKTVPATSDGDPVRVATCPFTGADYTAPSDATRPLLWDEGGGKWSLSFDGVDDFLTATTSTTEDQTTGWSFYNGIASIQIIGGRSTVNGELFSGAVAGQFQYSSGFGGRSAIITNVVNAWASVVTGDAPTGIFIKTATQSNTGAAGSDTYELSKAGGRTAGVLPATMRLAALIATSATMSAGDQTSLLAYLTALQP